MLLVCLQTAAAVGQMWTSTLSVYFQDGCLNSSWDKLQSQFNCLTEIEFMTCIQLCIMSGLSFFSSCRAACVWGRVSDLFLAGSRIYCGNDTEKPRGSVCHGVVGLSSNVILYQIFNIPAYYIMKYTMRRIPAGTADARFLDISTTNYDRTML